MNSQRKQKTDETRFRTTDLLFDFQGLCPEYGGVAQLGEHLPCKQGVKGSIPFISTSGESPQTNSNKLHQSLKRITRWGFW